MLHASEDARVAAVLVNSAGGGIEGPSGVYEELACLRADGVTVLRPDYRRPNDLAERTRDALAALDILGTERAVLGPLLDEGGAQSCRWDEAPLPVQLPQDSEFLER